MDYYRPQIASGPPNTADANTILNMASDSYASDYWNIPYSNGLSPMKQIEGNIFKGKQKMYRFWFWTITI